MKEKLLYAVITYNHKYKRFIWFYRDPTWWLQAGGLDEAVARKQQPLGPSHSPDRTGHDIDLSMATSCASMGGGVGWLYWIDAPDRRRKA